MSTLIVKHRDALISVSITAGLLLTLFFLLPPPTLVEPWKFVLRKGTYAAYAICFFVYFWKVRFDKFGALAIGYWLLLMVVGFFSGISLLTCIRYNLPYTAALLLGRALFPSRKKELLWAVWLLVTVYCLVNCLGLKLAPYGDPVLYPDWRQGFLGNRNSFSRYYLAALCSSALLDSLGHKRLSMRTVATLAIACANALILPSATSSVALVFFVVALALIQSQKLRGALNAASYGIAYLALFFGIVIFRLQNLLSPIIVDTMHKNLSFTGRTYIWDNVIQNLPSNPLRLFFGYYGSDFQMSPDNPAITTAHNAVLEILTTGGIIGFALLCAIFVLVIFGLSKNKHSLEAAILATYLGAFFILGLMEHITCAQLWLFLGMAGSLTAKKMPQEASSRRSLGAETPPSKQA